MFLVRKAVWPSTNAAMEPFGWANFVSVCRWRINPSVASCGDIQWTAYFSGTSTTINVSLGLSVIAANGVGSVGLKQPPGATTAKYVVCGLSRLPEGQTYVDTLV